MTLKISDLQKNYPSISSHDLTNRFTYHAPSKGEVELYEQIRAEGHGMAQFIRDNTPPSPEQYEAIKSIELAVMWANAAQARHGDGGA